MYTMNLPGIAQIASYVTISRTNVARKKTKERLIYAIICVQTFIVLAPAIRRVTSAFRRHPPPFPLPSLYITG